MLLVAQAARGLPHMFVAGFMVVAAVAAVL